MSITCKTSEVTKTIKLHFEKPVFAIHPHYPDQELAFTEASITLTAAWDHKTNQWKPKKNPDGTSPRLELWAPRAKRVGDYGDVLRSDAFHVGGRFNPAPIPLTSIIKKSWVDETQESIRTHVLDTFWKPLLSA